MKCRMFIPTLLLPMLSITSASYDTDNDASTSTLELPLERVALNRPQKGEKVIQVKSRILLALEKFSTDFRRLNYHISANHSKNQDAIDEVYVFYMRMVLMHIRLADYVEGFLNDKVSWVHIVGLALAFNDYKHSADSDGFTQINSEFLTEVLLLYYRKNDELHYHTLTDHSRSLEHTRKELSDAKAEQAKLTADNHRLMEKVAELEATTQRLDQQPSDGQ
jgi:hypothetical protein